MTGVQRCTKGLNPFGERQLLIRSAHRIRRRGRPTRTLWHCSRQLEACRPRSLATLIPISLARPSKTCMAGVGKGKDRLPLKRLATDLSTGSFETQASVMVVIMSCQNSTSGGRVRSENARRATAVWDRSSSSQPLIRDMIRGYTISRDPGAYIQVRSFVRSVPSPIVNTVGGVWCLRMPPTFSQWA